MLKLKRRTLIETLHGILFLFAWCLAMTLVGCASRVELQKEHPQATEFAEDVFDFGQEVVQTVVETKLDLPHGSLEELFDNDIFPPLPK